MHIFKGRVAIIALLSCLLSTFSGVIIASRATAGEQPLSTGWSASFMPQSEVALGGLPAGPLQIQPSLVRPSRPTRRFGPSAVPEPRTLQSAGGSWSLIGPQPISTAYLEGDQNVGLTSGRITALATSPVDGQIVYAGSMGGGVWKSTNGGSDWSPLTDNEASLSIGSLAVDSTGEVIYAGTGEANRSTSQYGQGVLKSTDGGSSWTLLGQSVFAGHHIGSIAIDRTTSGSTQRVLAATDVGLFISNDGGETWTENTDIVENASLPYSSEKTPNGGITEIIQDPSNSAKFWAAISDFCNTEAGNIAVSTDHGDTWTDVNDFPGLPPAARLGLGVGAGGVAYTAFSNCKNELGDLQKTTNGGSTWTSLASAPGYKNYFDIGGGSQGDYDTVVKVDPTNASHVFFGGASALATSDGGAHFQNVFGSATCGETKSCPLHADFHAAAFSGANSLYVGNDGGVWSTTDLGGSGQRSDWTDLNATLVVTEFYYGTAHTLAHPLGGAQDNATLGNFPGDQPLPEFFSYYYGDGGFTAVDPGSSIAYGESQFLNMAKINTDTAQPTDTTPCDSYGEDANHRTLCESGAHSDHVGFIAPFVMDTSNPLHLLAGTTRVYSTTNGGTPAGSGSWQAISNDLTLGGSDVLSTMVIPPSGGTNTIYAGSEFGAVYRTNNGGSTWINATGNLPTADTDHYLYPYSVASGLAFNPSNQEEAWEANGEVGVGHVWYTNNGGSSWQDLSGALPNAPVLSILDDPTRPSTIYAGTYYGAFVCTSCGGPNPTPNWKQLGTGLPNVSIHFLSLTSDNEHIVAWTNGRGAWAMSRPTPTTLTVSKTGSGTGSVQCDSGSGAGPCANEYDQGTIVTLSASPDSGSSFAGWSGAGCSGSGDCVVTMDSAKSVTATFKGLIIPPSISIISPANGATYTRGQAVAAIYACAPTENTGVKTCSGPVAIGAAISTGSLGPHTFTVNAEDTDGAIASAAVNFTVVPALSPVSLPTTTLLFHPKKKIRTKQNIQVKFRFASVDATATFLCKLDKGRFDPCRSPKHYTVIPGRHNFSVKAVDSAGADPTPATFSFTVERKR